MSLQHSMCECGWAEGRELGRSMKYLVWPVKNLDFILWTMGSNQKIIIREVT